MSFEINKSVKHVGKIDWVNTLPHYNPVLAGRL